MSWTKGRHAFKFGADFIRDENNQNYLPNNLYGSFSFTGRYSGAAYADFLLGLPQTTGLSNPAPSSYLRGKMWSFYAQDQFKVTPAAHFELRRAVGTDGPLSRQVRADFQLQSGRGRAGRARTTASSSSIRYFPKNVKILTASQAGYPDGSLLDFQKHNFYPRVGLAYKLTSNGKTVIRAGYGSVREYRSTARSRGIMEGGPFGGSETFFNSITNGAPLLSFPNPFVPAAGQVAAFQSASGFQSAPERALSPAMERDPGEANRHASDVSVAYVGSHAVNLLYGRNINQPCPSTTPFSISALPNPNFDTITLYENGGSQRYNSLQVSAAKRMGKNLHFSAGWTWARDLTDQSDNDWVFADNPIQNQFDRAAEWGNNAYTPTHRFYADAIYRSPGRDATSAS